MAKTTPKKSMNWNVIEVTSGYGANTRSPFIEVHTDKLKEKLQLAPNEARDLAMNLLQAAEAAEQDAFLFEFTEEALENENAAASMVGKFREWRKNHGMNK